MLVSGPRCRNIFPILIPSGSKSSVCTRSCHPELGLALAEVFCQVYLICQFVSLILILCLVHYNRLPQCRVIAVSSTVSYLTVLCSSLLPSVSVKYLSKGLPRYVSFRSFYSFSGCFTNSPRFTTGMWVLARLLFYKSKISYFWGDEVSVSPWYQLMPSSRIVFSVCRMCLTKEVVK